MTIRGKKFARVANLEVERHRRRRRPRRHRRRCRWSCQCRLHIFPRQDKVEKISKRAN